MAVYTLVSTESLSAFLQGYAVGELVSAKGIAEGVENTNYLVDTTAGRFILTLYEKRVAAGDLPYFMALLDHLAAAGLPVPRAIRGSDGVAIRALEGRPACLIEFLPGVSLSQPTRAQARAAGVSLGQLHRAAEDFPEVRANSMGADQWRPLFERCGRGLDAVEPGLHDTLAEELDRVLAAWDPALPRSTIHADLFPDNVLMRGDAVSGLIDFYFACTDSRAFDLAIMHTAWSFDATGTHGDWAIGQALIDGYQQSIQLTGEERAAFQALCEGACIRFLLSRAWDWLNTPADALVTRKDPLAYWRRLQTYKNQGSLFA
ncbi:homoserine kinase [Sphingomonas xinjiangensis]|uniref:Homoserine kinase n=1 Tax=Sphingomonas xinjiangensis TaxID=643568 RepID=A0A840YK98_9SPHN|nr:homoserine kinase [Sphingomonas xinjiangensis]MBB5711548.1 homoserine kinase type II [Sphingomonas xinjiangensis]